MVLLGGSEEERKHAQHSTDQGAKTLGGSLGMYATVMSVRGPQTGKAGRQTSVILCIPRWETGHAGPHNGTLNQISP